MAVSSRAGREHTKPSQATDTRCALWLMEAVGRKKTASRTQSGWESCGRGAWLETVFFLLGSMWPTPAYLKQSGDQKPRAEGEYARGGQAETCRRHGGALSHGRV